MFRLVIPKFANLLLQIANFGMTKRNITKPLEAYMMNLPISFAHQADELSQNTDIQTQFQS